MLTLDTEKHAYELDGRPIPSVTQIIGAEYSNPYWTPRGRDRGTAVHSAVQYLIQGDLDEESIDPQWAGYLQAFKAWQGLVNPIIREVEKRVYNRKLNYAGTVDLVVEVHGKRALIDLKTGDSTTVGIQLSAYQMCFEGAPTLYALKLCGDGNFRFRQVGGLHERVKFAALCGDYHRRMSV